MLVPLPLDTYHSDRAHHDWEVVVYAVGRSQFRTHSHWDQSQC